MAGKVWLVGAGPSDVGLLTIKGKEVLEQAEVVVYDALVGAGILSLIPPEAEKINAGKRASHHLIKQEVTNQILLEKAMEGKKVVRLKGGDPFLFGRGGEELELLAENGIEYEIVPGVTSAISVPAYCGIPVTHRDFCSSVHIITGHKKKDEPLDINFKALAEAGGTLVFLMGISNLSEICMGLINGGMAPNTPAAVLQKGASAEQKTLVSTLDTLPAEALKQKVEMPAIIVVGEVCGLSEKFSWVEKLPLFGCRVAVTRPRERQGTLSKRLRELGAQVIEIPTISIQRYVNNTRLEETIKDIETYNWLVFTSPAGVEIFFDRLFSAKKDIRCLAHAKIAAIGGGTAKSLAEIGLIADLVPEIYDGKHLGVKLSKCLNSGDKILIPRASIGSKELIEEISKKEGVAIDDLPVYDTVYECPEVPDIKMEFEDHPQTVAVFTSASTVRGFAKAVEGLDLTNVTALCIGRQTADQAQKFGMDIKIAEKATIGALIDLVIKNHGNTINR
jgi:uroporphyrinogen III methyltransferase/synthase